MLVLAADGDPPFHRRIDVRPTHKHELSVQRDRVAGDAGIDPYAPEAARDLRGRHQSEPTSVPPLVFVTVTVTHSLARAAALGVRADGALGVTGSSAQAPSVARPRRWKASRQRPARGMNDCMAVPRLIVVLRFFRRTEGGNRATLTDTPTRAPVSGFRSPAPFRVTSLLDLPLSQRLADEETAVRQDTQLDGDRLAGRVPRSPC